MAEPDQDEDPFAGMSATSSTVRRKSEPPDTDPFADAAPPRSTLTRRALDRDESATVQEMPGFLADDGLNPGIPALAPRKDDSLRRLELAARLPDPTGPAPRTAAVHPTVPLSPTELAAAAASSPPVKESGPRRVAAAPTVPESAPGPTLPESVGALGERSEHPIDDAKRRRALGQQKAAPARTQQLLGAIRPDETGPVRAPRLAPRVAAGARRPTASRRAQVPTVVWLAIGLVAGIGCTLLAVWLLA